MKFALPSPRNLLKLRAPLLGALAALSLCSPARLCAETTNASGATAITGPTILITQPGTYYLANDITVNMANAAPINIQASNVTIDLNGHTLTNTAGAANACYGVYAANQSGITIRNGTITGFYYGVLLVAGSPYTASLGHLVEDVRLSQNTFCALNVQGIGCVVRRCRAVGTGGNTLSNTQGAAYNLAIDGPANTVIDCDVGNKAAGVTTAYGISYNNGSDAAIVNNRISGVTVGLYFLNNNVGCKYRDNLFGASVATKVVGGGGTDAGNNN